MDFPCHCLKMATGALAEEPLQDFDKDAKLPVIGMTNPEKELDTFIVEFSDGVKSSVNLQDAFLNYKKKRQVCRNY